MKLPKIFFFLLLSLAIFTSSCSSDPCGKNKDAFVKNYTAFFDYVKTNHKTMQTSDWEKQDLKMRHFIKECVPKYKTELGITEHKDFWIGTIRYFNARYGLLELGLRIAKGGEMFDDLTNAIKELSLDWKSLISF
jgi:hypothetical protein